MAVGTVDVHQSQRQPEQVRPRLWKAEGTREAEQNPVLARALEQGRAGVFRRGPLDGERPAVADAPGMEDASAAKARQPFEHRTGRCCRRRRHSGVDRRSGATFRALWRWGMGVSGRHATGCTREPDGLTPSAPPVRVARPGRRCMTLIAGSTRDVVDAQRDNQGSAEGWAVLHPAAAWGSRASPTSAASIEAAALRISAAAPGVACGSTATQGRARSARRGSDARGRGPRSPPRRGPARPC